MGQKKVFKKNKKIVSRVIGEETVLLPLFKSSDDIQCIYTLNKAASWVWEKLDGRMDLDGLRREALAAFEVTPAEFDRSIQKMIRDLKSIDAITEAA